MHSLKAGGQNVRTTICTGLCHPVPKGMAGCDRGGAMEVPDAGAQRDFHIASHLPLLDGLCMSFDLTLFVLPTHVLFVWQGCCLDRSWGIVLFVGDFQICATLTLCEISSLYHMSMKLDLLEALSLSWNVLTSGVWLCSAHRVSLLLYRKHQAYIACSVVEVWSQKKRGHERKSGQRRGRMLPPCLCLW